MDGWLVGWMVGGEGRLGSYGQAKRKTTLRRCRYIYIYFYPYLISVLGLGLVLVQVLFLV